VVLSTWHAAKGLEWPVTVLSDLADAPRDARFGVFVEPAEGEFDFARPLAGRWLRYWPSPFLAARKRTALHERIAADPATEARERRAGREALRLLYVGWTRARDLLVLAGRAPGRSGSPLARGTAGTLAADGAPLLAEPDGDVVRWAGQEHAIRVRRLTPLEAPRVPPTAGEGYVATGPRQHPPARLSPSGANHRAVAGTDATSRSVPTLETIGEPIAVRGEPDAGALGSAIHRFLAADDAGAPRAERVAMAETLLRRWEVAVDTLEPADLVRAADGLDRWLESTWPAARRHREWPLAQRLESGTIVAGNADLVLEVDGGLVLVDHKLLLGPEETLAAAASSFAPQLAAYAAALTAATGRPVLARVVHLPLHGVVFRLDTAEPSHP
jgi:ATP-dependent exoDNAse (exonuclease V) beta subunit